MTELKTKITVISMTMNEPNSSIKRKRFSIWLIEQDTAIQCIQETHILKKEEEESPKLRDEPKRPKEKIKIRRGDRSGKLVVDSCPCLSAVSLSTVSVT